MCWRSAESQGSPRLWCWLRPMPAPRTPGCLTRPPGHMEAGTPAALRPEAILPAAPSVRTLPWDPGPSEGCPLQGPPLGGHNGPGVLADTSGGWGWGRSQGPLKAWPNGLGVQEGWSPGDPEGGASPVASAWRPGQVTYERGDRGALETAARPGWLTWKEQPLGDGAVLI